MFVAMTRYLLRAAASAVRLMGRGRVGLIFFLPLTAFAAPPGVTAIEPRVWQIGAAQRVTIRGQNLKAAKDLKVFGAIEARLAEGVENNGQMPDRVVFDVRVPSEAVAGPVVTTVVGPTGASPPQLVVLDRLPVVAQAGGNTRPETAQEIPAVAAVSGTVNNLARHYFTFRGKAGQRIAFEVVARRIGSSLDPLLRVFDSRFRELAYADDTQGLLGDCRLKLTLPADDTYFVELRDIRYQGGPQHFFVLRIGDFPTEFVPQPLGVPAERTTKVRFVGESDLAETSVSAGDRRGTWLAVPVRRVGGGHESTAFVVVGREAELVEHEPNDTAENAQMVPLDCGVTGRLAQPGDRDVFAFTAPKGAVVRVDAVARQAHLPTLLHVQIEDASGKRLAAVEDLGVAQPTLRATMAADGTYRVVVRDLRGEGGPTHGYRLQITRLVPAIRVDAGAVGVNVAPGTAMAVPVGIDRGAYSGGLRLRAVDLPPGFVSEPTLVAPGVTESAITIAAQSPPQASAGAFRVLAEPLAGDGPLPVATTALRGWQAVVGLKWPPPSVTHVQYVAAAEPQPFRLAASVREVTVGQRLSQNVTVRAQRADKYDAPINLALVPEKGGLPGGLTVKTASIAKGKSEASVTISASEKVVPGRYTIVLAAVTKAKNATTILQAVPPITVTVRPTIGLQTRVERPELKPGQKTVVHIELDRSPGLNGPVQLELVGLPAGVKAEPQTVAGDKAVADVPLLVAADAQPMPAVRVRVRATVTIGKNKVTIESEGPTVSIAR